MTNQQTKTVYMIVSLRNETPVYRIYNKKQAEIILEKCRERYPDKHFWMEEKKIDTFESTSI
jgi:hypothetical protein